MMRLQQRLKRVDGQAGVAYDTAHGEGVHGIVAGVVKIRTPSVMTMCLPWRAIRKTSFLQGTSGIEVVDARQLTHD